LHLLTLLPMNLCAGLRPPQRTVMCTFPHPSSLPLLPREHWPFSCPPSRFAWSSVNCVAFGLQNPLSFFFPFYLPYQAWFTFCGLPNCSGNKSVTFFRHFRSWTPAFFTTARSLCVPRSFCFFSLTLSVSPPQRI